MGAIIWGRVSGVKNYEPIQPIPVPLPKRASRRWIGIGASSWMQTFTAQRLSPAPKTVCQSCGTEPNRCGCRARIVHVTAYAATEPVTGAPGNANECQHLGFGLVHEHEDSQGKDNRGDDPFE